MAEFVIFFFFAAVAVVFALVVVLHRNPVVGALSLVASFFALAVMYVLLEAPFLAALQVIVYAGAIMVLFLFVIMLLNLQHMAEPATRPVQQFLSYTACSAFGVGLIYYLLKYAVFARLPEGPFRADARAIGMKMFEAYVFPFEMVSILLLAAIVGALLLSGRVAGERAKVGEELPPMIPTHYFLILSAILFTIGMIGVLTRKNGITIFMSIELMVNAVNLTFLAYARQFGDLHGLMFVFFIMAVAAAEAAVGLAIFISLFHHRDTIDVDEANLMHW